MESAGGDGKMRDKPYWLALSQISVLGARRIHRLVEAFGSAEKAFSADEDQLMEAGLPAKAAAVITEERKQIDPDVLTERLHRMGMEAMTLADPLYPGLLKEIYDPPAVLYYRGNPKILAAPAIALVGARKATQYGKTTAYRLGSELASLGITVVSGMARGIDTAAHQGALQGGGNTAAVLGCGADICYPPENRSLREAIANRGILLSEFVPGTPPKPPHFPMRNRIISGLSLAVTVVEAAEKSGALITADCALEQGRDVLAVPGSIHSPASRGCHRLLREGAAVVEHVADILRAVHLYTEAETNIQTAQLSVAQQNVLRAMEFEPAHFDVIAGRVNMPAAALAVVLVELELAGSVRKMTGNYYLRV
jgi:DNA processing protein